jgi:hypothetical protein
MGHFKKLKAKERVDPATSSFDGIWGLREHPSMRLKPSSISRLALSIYNATT